MASFQTDVALDSDVRIKNGQRMWLRLSLLYKLCLHHHLLKLILKLQTIKNRSSKLRIICQVDVWRRWAMALLQTRISLHSYVRIAIGQRMRLHLILIFKLCLKHNLLRLLWKPETGRNRMSIFRATYKTNKEITKYETMYQGMTTIN